MDIELFQRIASEWGLSVSILIAVIFYLIKVYGKQSSAIVESLDKLNETTRDFKETNNFMRTRIEEGSAKLDKGEEALLEIKEQLKHHTSAIAQLTNRLDLLSKIDTQEMKAELQKLENKIDSLK